MECASKFAKIVPGSKVVFDLILRRPGGVPFNLAPYTTGKLVFLNCSGVRTEITLTVPGANPGAGIIQVTLTAVNTAPADGKWKDADLILGDGTPGNDEIYPLDDKFEIVTRNVPPAP